MTPHTPRPIVPLPNSEFRSRSPVRTIRTILTAAVAVGVLDGTDAVMFFGARGVSAQRIFQHIASALLGKASFTEGWASVALGVAIHFGVAVGLAATYVLLARSMPGLFRRWFWAGVAYGILSYAAMNFAVLPLTRVARPGGFPPLPILLNGVFAHVFCVGVPIAWVVARSVCGSAKRSTTAAAAVSL